MASVDKVTTAEGEIRYRVRYRAGGRAVEKWARTKSAAIAMKRQVESDEEGLVFTSPRGEPARPASISQAWRAACQASGAPGGLRLHDLRHHAATLTARMPGVTTKELMARIGHASPRAALRYQQATAERDRAIAAFLDDQIKAEHRDERAPIMPMPNSARPVAAGSEP